MGRTDPDEHEYEEGHRQHDTNDHETQGQHFELNGGNLTSRKIPPVGRMRLNRRD